MRKPREVHLYERIIKSLPLLNDESLAALSALSRQLITARRMARERLLNQGGAKPTPALSTEGVPDAKQD